MKILRNYVSYKPDAATSLCEQALETEEFVVHVVQATTLYTRLRFSLLCSPWLPRALGVMLWSGLHMVLVVYEALMLVALFSLVLVLAVLADAYFVLLGIGFVVMFPVVALGVGAGMGLALIFMWLWLLISCQCCTMPAPASGQSLARYVCTAGGNFPLEDPRPAPVMERGGAAATARAAILAREVWDFLKERCRGSLTLYFLNHVKDESAPYQKANMANLCREIVPLYDTIVVTP